MHKSSVGEILAESLPWGMVEKYLANLNLNKKIYMHLL